MKKLFKNETGITLIALVITIIVLLILAGVSISILTGENGILTQAQNAKEQNEIANVKEQAKLDIMAWTANELANGRIGILDDAIIKTIIIGKDYVDTLTDDSFTTKEGHTILYKDLYTEQTPPSGGNEAEVGVKVTGPENKTYTNNGTAVIPVGFTIVPGLDDVSEGLVISDNEADTELDEDETKHVANGNQFIWVPVSKENFATEFVREHFGTEGQKWWTGTFAIDRLSANNMYEPVADEITVDPTASESVQEVQKMYKSVKDNGGFYIARYEAGKDESNTVLCKKGVSVYNNIGWADTDDMTDETGGAVEKARGFSEANNYTSVTSTLVYGVQWDAVLRWISKDDELKGYLTNSKGKGNYSDSDSTNNPAKTGAVKEYQLKNIYDIAGNVYEWTMESYYTSSRVSRGGHYNNVGVGDPVSNRGGRSPSYSVDGIGFRVALYL